MHHNLIKKVILIVALCSLAIFITLYFNGDMSSPAGKLGFYCAAISLLSLIVALVLQIRNST